MAKGYPDYYGGDIFKRRGDIVAVSYTAQVVAHNNYFHPISTSKKGETVGGFIEVYECVDPTNLGIWVYIDNESMSEMVASAMFALDLTQPLSLPIYLLRYDEENQIYIFCLSGGITFTTGYHIRVVNDTGASVKVTSVVSYYDLT